MLEQREDIKRLKNPDAVGQPSCKGELEGGRPLAPSNNRTRRRWMAAESSLAVFSGFRVFVSRPLQFLVELTSAERIGVQGHRRSIGKNFHRPRLGSSCGIILFFSHQPARHSPRSQTSTRDYFLAKRQDSGLGLRQSLCWLRRYRRRPLSAGLSRLIRRPELSLCQIIGLHHRCNNSRALLRTCLFSRKGHHRLRHSRTPLRAERENGCRRGLSGRASLRPPAQGFI